ncbi:DUF2946 domain-containing protein [Paraburkholderia sp.]|uniref:DUF2946 domain-containing protein n=1 Tax=Paraburkholderia sp. TaxID=1926495 RepID=UPI0025ED38AC|nr:DUF2946 domain-containing protein [Paraburkholderia sp.]
MSRIRLRKLGSLLGLLAILMSVLAPAISQTLVEHHRAGGMHSSFCAMGDDAAADSHGSPHHSQAQHGDACPYCTLFANVPVLPGTAVQFPVTFAVERANVNYTNHEVLSLTTWSAAQPRAPPAFS